MKTKIKKNKELSPEQLDKLAKFYDDNDKLFIKKLMQKHPKVIAANFEIIEFKILVIKSETQISFEYTAEINEGEGFVKTKSRKIFKI